MGWTFILGADRKRIIEEIVSPENRPDSRFETLRYCARGNVLWAVHQVTDRKSMEKTRFIGCHLLQRRAEGQGMHKITSWGYKSMDESVYPYYFTCPLTYLDDAPATCEKWRDQVRIYNRKYAIGERLGLVQGCRIPYVDVVSLRPFIGVYQDQRYRLKRNLIDKVIDPTDSALAA